MCYVSDRCSHKGRWLSSDQLAKTRLITEHRYFRADFENISLDRIAHILAYKHFFINTYETIKYICGLENNSLRIHPDALYTGVLSIIRCARLKGAYSLKSELFLPTDSEKQLHR